MAGISTMFFSSGATGVLTSQRSFGRNKYIYMTCCIYTSEVSLQLYHNVHAAALVWLNSKVARWVFYFYYLKKKGLTVIKLSAFYFIFFFLNKAPNIVCFQIWLLVIEFPFTPKDFFFLFPSQFFDFSRFTRTSSLIDAKQRLNAVAFK